jgi:hypothetical protein
VSTRRTDEHLWRQIVAKVTAADSGGRAGQWSARKAQIAVQRYKAAGGGYIGPKEADNALDRWTHEEWRTRSGRPSLETGERYLPAAAIDALTPQEYAATTRAKRRGMEHGQQFVPQPLAIAAKVAPFRRRNPEDRPPLHLPAGGMLDTRTYYPVRGDRFTLVVPRTGYTFDAVVSGVKDGVARIVQLQPDEPLPDAETRGTPVPAASVAHFANDLNGRVYGQHTGTPEIDAVLDGRAQFLGKGQDGIAFRVGDSVVKVSTTVPFQPFNSGHLSPEQSIARVLRQHDAVEQMRAAGVPGLLPERVEVHGDKAFTVKPYLTIPDTLTQEQLDSVAASIIAAHAAGWVWADEIQVGTLGDRLYHFDTGQAQRSQRTDAEDRMSDAYLDIQALKRLFEKYGANYLTERERISPVDEYWALIKASYGTPEERREAGRRLLLLYSRLDLYALNNPNARDLGLLADKDFRIEATKEAMARTRE